MSMQQAQKWCDRNVPSMEIKTFDQLIPAISYALGTTERHLRDMVELEFLDEDSFSHITMSHWVESCNVTKDQLLEHYTMQDLLVDSLFLWLGTIAMKTHLNYIHNSCVWTSCGSKNPDMWDAVVLFTEKYFIAVPSVNSHTAKAVVKDSFCNPLDTLQRYVDHPLVLNRPVKNVAQHCLDIDVTMIGTPRLLQCLLAELCSLLAVHYCIHLIGWLQWNVS